MPRPRKPKQVRFVTTVDEELKKKFDSLLINQETGKIRVGTYQMMVTNWMKHYIECVGG